MARKAKNYPQFNWRANPETLKWLKAQAEELECAVADLLERGVKLLRDTMENSDGKPSE